MSYPDDDEIDFLGNSERPSTHFAGADFDSTQTTKKIVVEFRQYDPYAHDRLKHTVQSAQAEKIYPFDRFTPKGCS